MAIVTQQMRETIANWIQQNAFKEERKVLAEEFLTWSIKRRHSYNGGEEITKKMQALPEHLFYQRAVTIPYYVDAGFRVDSVILPEACMKSPTYYGDPSLKEEEDKLDVRWGIIRHQIEKLKQDTEVALRQLRTVKRAREIFPEFSAMLPDDSVAASQALVVQYDTLKHQLCEAAVIDCDDKSEEAEKVA